MTSAAYDDVSRMIVINQVAMDTFSNDICLQYSTCARTIYICREVRSVCQDSVSLLRWIFSGAGGAAPVRACEHGGPSERAVQPFISLRHAVCQLSTTGRRSALTVRRRRVASCRGLRGPSLLPIIGLSV